MPRVMLNIISDNKIGAETFTKHKSKEGFPLCPLFRSMLQMSYGVRSNTNDELSRMSETVLSEVLHRFCNTIISELNNNPIRRYPTLGQKKGV